MAGKSTPGLTPVLERNIRLLSERKQREVAEASFGDRVAVEVTRLAGSMGFVCLHIAFFGFWIIANLGLIGSLPRWDPSFVVLATCASVEAIFLSTFVLISQNRMAEADAKRADLDLQISLLSEHEITKLATLLDAVARKIGVPVEGDRELEDVKQDVAPGEVLDQIESAAPGGG
jgi:uncharacterized membrane protein